MKKEILNVIHTPNTEIRCCRYGLLRHYTGLDGTDNLDITFFNDKFRSISYKISSREYKNVLSEIAKYHKEYFNTLSEEVANAFQNGILN